MSPIPFFSRLLRLRLLVGLGLCGCASGQVVGLTVTNVVTANVTPSSFSVIWNAGEAATPSIQVFADASGTQSLEGQVAVQAFPLHTGRPSASTEFEQRQSIRSIQGKTRGLGSMHVQVSGCRPNTLYYFKLQVANGTGQQMVWPASGPLPSVKTSQENSFVLHSKHLLLTFPGADLEGRVVTISSLDAAYPVAAVVGDGAGTNQVFLNLDDLFALSGAGNYTPLGKQEFQVDIQGPNLPRNQATYLLEFTSNFAVSDSDGQSFGQEFLTVRLGSTLLQTGQSGSITLYLDTTVEVANLSFNFPLPTNRLHSLRLEPISPAVGVTFDASNPLLPTVRAQATAGQTLKGNQPIAQLFFTTVSNQSSAFIRVVPSQIDARKLDNAPVGNLFGQSGRIAVVGQEPLLEATLTTNQTRALVLYGKPWAAYQIQWSERATANANWQNWIRVPLTNIVFTIPETPPGGVQASFYRAAELLADPPLLESRPTGRGSFDVVLYGRPQNRYQLQGSTNLSAAIPWFPMAEYTATNSFRILDGGLMTNQVRLYRAGRL